jgi:hypothetical protein
MSIVAVMSIVSAMPNAVLPVDAPVRGHDGAVRPVAVAAMHDGFAAGGAMCGDAGIFAGLTNRIFDGFTEFVQRVAVVLIGQCCRRHKGASQGAHQSGDDTAGEGAQEIGTNHFLLLLPCKCQGSQYSGRQASHTPVSALSR